MKSSQNSLNWTLVGSPDLLHAIQLFCSQDHPAACVCGNQETKEPAKCKAGRVLPAIGFRL